MLSTRKSSGTKEAEASVHQMIALLERPEQHESPQSLEQFILDRRPDCRGHRPRLQFIQAFNHFLHATDHQREPLVVELVWRVVG
jgi:hypothetical protein